MTIKKGKPKMNFHWPHVHWLIGHLGPLPLLWMLGNVGSIIFYLHDSLSGLHITELSSAALT